MTDLAVMIEKSVEHIIKAPETVSEARSRVAHGVNFIAYIFDSDLRVVYVNRAIGGIEPEDAVGLEFNQIYRGEIRDAMARGFDKAIQLNGRPSSFFVELPTSQGLARFHEQVTYQESTGQFFGVGVLVGFV